VKDALTTTVYAVEGGLDGQSRISKSSSPQFGLRSKGFKIDEHIDEQVNFPLPESKSCEFQGISKKD
jgi:hypothetical protein